MTHPVSAAIDSALDLSVVGGYTRLGLAARRRLPGWPPDSPSGALVETHVVVTGASSGLGEACVQMLHDLGAHVHLVVRDEAKGEDVARGVDAGLARLTTWRCDLSDLDDVRDLAGRLLEAGVALRGLVHNAGALPPERTESEQGHEQTMALHVLGPVLLTDLLLPALTDDARVVLVTSGGMYTQDLPVDDPEYLRGEYAGATAYARSKRTQVEILGALQERWGAHGVAVYATHPGWASTPGITASLPRFERVTRPVLRSAQEGADTSVWLVATRPRRVGGGLWHDRRPRPTAYLGRHATTPADRARMWDWVAGAAGLAR